MELDVSAFLPPDVVELIRRGQLSVAIEQLPAVEYLPGKCYSEFVILLNGEPYRIGSIQFEISPENRRADRQPCARNESGPPNNLTDSMA